MNVLSRPSSMAPLFLFLLMASITLAYGLSLGAFTEAHALQSPPGRTPLPPPTPPAPEPCPTDFTDHSCDAPGSGYGTEYTEAKGEALTECDYSYFQCQVSQANERFAARNKCQAVPGCVFSDDPPVDVQCHITNGPDCMHLRFQDADGHWVDWYYCRSNAEFNNTGYRCERPIPKEPDQH